jgi:hypothetical protein
MRPIVAEPGIVGAERPGLASLVRSLWKDPGSRIVNTFYESSLKLCRKKRRLLSH